MMGAMRADVLRGHLDTLLLAVLADASGHGYELGRRLTSAAAASSGVPEGRCTGAAPPGACGTRRQRVERERRAPPAHLSADGGRTPGGRHTAAGVAAFSAAVDKVLGATT
jgi:hypothetical protein